MMSMCVYICTCVCVSHESHINSIRDLYTKDIRSPLYTECVFVAMCAYFVFELMGQSLLL